MPARWQDLKTGLFATLIPLVFVGGRTYTGEKRAKDTDPDAPRSTSS